MLIPSGAGAPGFAGIFHCLKMEPDLTVLAGDMDPKAYGRKLADDFFLVPASNNPGYADFILELALKKKVNFILPVTTRELLPLAEADSIFSRHGIRLISSPIQALRVANNKANTYEKLAGAGLPHPYFNKVNTLEALISEANKLISRQRVIFKPAVGNGSRGFGIIRSRSESQRRNLLLEKPGNPLYRMEELPFLLPDKFDTDMLVCEYLPGQEYSVDVLADHGRVRYALVRTREQMIGGISVRGRFEKHEGILSQTEQICALVNLHGPVGMQFRLREDSTPILLEINPRLQGTASSSIGAGVNLPLDALRLEQGKQVQGSASAIRWGVEFSRHWNELFF